MLAALCHTPLLRFGATQVAGGGGKVLGMNVGVEGENGPHGIDVKAMNTIDMARAIVAMMIVLLPGLANGVFNCHLELFVVTRR